MATREKTIRYAFPLFTGTTTDAVAQDLTQITIAIPETVVAFRSVQVRWYAQDVITATGGTWTERRTSLRLAAVAYETVTNTSDITQSGENMSVVVAADYTSYFETNWTGTSMTCDLQVYCDQSTGTTLGLRNISAEALITYSYDDTATTHIKTALIPLAAYNGASPTSKPGTAQATIPALDTWLPEASKVYRDCYIVWQGNEQGGSSTVDRTLSHEIDTLGVVTTGTIERALASDRWNVYHHKKFAADAVTFDTSVTHNLFFWNSIADDDHPQAFLVVTYEFDESATTTVLQSLMLPMEWASPAGNSASTWNRADRELWIQEPGTITPLTSSILLFWEQIAPVAGLNARVGTGSFTSFTDVASALCGGNGAQLVFTPTLARGRNVLSADVYRTDTTDLMWNMCGVWLVNYTSSKHSSGVGVHNKTVVHNLLTVGTVASRAEWVTSAIAPVISETDYFLNAVGTHCQYVLASGGAQGGSSVQCELTSGEGGFTWLSAYADGLHTDAEVGIRQTWSQVRSIFRRWIGDTDASRLDVETARRWRACQTSACFPTLDMYLTYHSIIFSVTGNVTASDGGTVTLELHRVTSGEKVKSTSRVGNGAFSFTWYDDTEELFVVAYESGTHMGRSANDLAS